MKRLIAACLTTSFLYCSNGLLAAQAGQGSDLDARRARFREAIAAQWQYELKTHPRLATYVGDARYNDRLGDFSAEAIAAEDAEDKRQLALFTAIDTTGFPPEVRGRTTSSRPCARCWGPSPRAVRRGPFACGGGHRWARRWRSATTCAIPQRSR